MKRSFIFGIILFVIVTAGCAGSQNNGVSPTTGSDIASSPLIFNVGFSMSDPAPVNQAVTFTEHVNDSGQGPADYTARLTLREVLRGQAAYDKIKQSYPSYLINIQPDREFMAVHFKYDLTDTSKPGITRLVNRDLFAIYRDGKLDAEDNKYIVGASPDLYGKVKSGGTVDGWFTFTVPKGASWPLIVYDKPAAGNSGIWFKTG